MSDIDPDPARRRPRVFRLPGAEAVPEPAPAEPSRAEPEPEPPRTAPRAFRTEPTEPVTGVSFVEQPDVFPLDGVPDLDAPDTDEAAIEIAQARGMRRHGLFSWSGLFWSAAGGLVSLAVGLWIDRFIEDLFARVPQLGWVALGLLGLALLALLALGIREGLGIARQRRVADLHKAAADAHANDDTRKARAILKDLTALYIARPETAKARKALDGLGTDIIDGRDLIELTERHLMTPLDREVRREIAQAAKRVSVVTAISPRAILDLLFVIGQTIRLIRRIAEIYSGRPGLLGFLRLARSVGAHLAITGGMAVGDSLLQQVVGHGIAAKLSRRLGEGVLNGLLTTRVGLSAMAVCRPMPFAATRQPGVRDVAPFLFGEGE